MDVDNSGPIFDGTAIHIVDDFADSAVRALGEQGIAEVHHNLNSSIKNATPYYETQVSIRENRDGVSITDRGVIYGHWLEGDGSRNKKTRFKGYWSFRKARQYLERNSDRVIRSHIAAMIRRLS